MAKRKTSDHRTKEEAVFIAATPNAEIDDVKLCSRLLLSKSIISGDTPIYKDRDGSLAKESSARSPVDRVHYEFANIFGIKNAFSFNSGRAALYMILKAFGIQNGDEVIIQAYTCLAVPTGIMWAKAKPVYADIQKGSFNPSPEQFRSAISPKTRAIVVQHTFGEIADIDRIKDIIKEKNLDRAADDRIILIEDCAHSLGLKKDGMPLGKNGDAAFFSFGQDKVISCTQGGLAVIHDKKAQSRLSKLYTATLPPSTRNTVRALLHPILWADIKKYYYFPSWGKATLGRMLLLVYKTLGLLANQADPSRIDTETPDCTRLSNGQAQMLLNQIPKLERFTKHRKKLSQIYDKRLPKDIRLEKRSGIYLRYPLQIERPEELGEHLREFRVIPGNWYSNVIHPKGTPLKHFGYTPGTCPIAERAAEKSINLPTNILTSESDAKRIAQIATRYLSSRKQ